MSDVVDNILAHHGTKGMRWGVRKSTGAAGKRLTKQPYHADYNTKRRASDKGQFGKGGVNRINNQLRKGLTYDQARNRETRRSQNRAAIKAGSVAIAYLLATSPNAGSIARGVSDQVASKIGDRAETQRGRDFAANHFGLGPDSTIKAPQNSDGSYKVTSM